MTESMEVLDRCPRCGSVNIAHSNKSRTRGFCPMCLFDNRTEHQIPDPDEGSSETFLPAEEGEVSEFHGDKVEEEPEGLVAGPQMTTSASFGRRKMRLPEAENTDPLAVPVDPEDLPEDRTAAAPRKAAKKAAEKKAAPKK